MPVSGEKKMLLIILPIAEKPACCTKAAFREVLVLIYRVPSRSLEVFLSDLTDLGVVPISALGHLVGYLP